MGKQDRHKASVFWKGMLAVRQLTYHSLDYKLERGNNIVFWYDRWYSQILLKTLFPDVFQKINNKMPECVIIGDVQDRDGT